MNFMSRAICLLDLPLLLFLLTAQTQIPKSNGRIMGNGCLHKANWFKKGENVGIVPSAGVRWKSIRLNGTHECLTACLENSHCSLVQTKHEKDDNVICNLTSLIRHDVSYQEKKGWNFYELHLEKISNVCPTGNNSDCELCQCLKVVNRFKEFKCTSDCSYYATDLGMGSGVIENAQIQASSEAHGGVIASFARLRRSSGWCADGTDTTPFLQVFFARVLEITAVAMQGRGGPISKWITKFLLSYKKSLDGSFEVITEHGEPKVFSGNVDTDSVVTHDLTPIVATAVRFTLVEKYGEHFCMRIELYGCYF